MRSSSRPGRVDDLRSGWLLILAVTCIAAVAGAAILRIVTAAMAPRGSERAAAMLAGTERHDRRELTGTGAR